jgi:hypothetical protein
MKDMQDVLESSYPVCRLEVAAHHFVIFTFRLVQKRAWIKAKPLQLGAPVAVLVRFIAALFGQLHALSFPVSDFVALN